MCITDRIYKNIIFCAVVSTAVDYTTQRAMLEESSIIVLLISLWLCSDLLSISLETHSKP